MIYSKDIRLISQHDAVEASIARFLDNRKRPWGLYGIDTGIHDLNMAIGGWIPQKLTVIAGRSGMGKTATVNQILDKGGIIDNKRRAEFLFCSWETDGSSIIDRHVCHKVGITMKQLSHGAKLLGESTVSRVSEEYKKADKLPITYQEMSLDVGYLSDVFTKFSEDCRKKGREEGISVLPVLVVDYIGLGRFRGNQNRTYDIGEFVNGVKNTLNDTGGAGVLYAQINRSSDEKDMPERRDLSDSQSIEQAADNLIILHRPEYNGVRYIKDPDTGIDIPSDNKALFRVLKARDYGTGDILLGCDIKYYRFFNIEHGWGYDYSSLYASKDFWLKELGLV